MVPYALTIALSAFLLFLVQPIIAKQILPWFGGSAAVWTTCMMFFQAVLLAGYAYSDFVVRRLEPGRQRIVHGSLLIVSLAFLPITLSESLRPLDAGNPVGQILSLLIISIGLPYFVLSTTGPLLQAWFTRQFPKARVYRLYALSNLASMAALIAYPPLIEPAASTDIQSIGWSAGYALFVLLGLTVLWRGRASFAVAVPAFSRKYAGAAGEGMAGEAMLGASSIAAIEKRASSIPASLGEGGLAEARGETSLAAGEVPSASGRSQVSPTVREQLLWLSLSALGSILLLSVTAHLTHNVASVPFLWLVPLALYLLSFILCFDGRGWYRQRLFFSLSVLSCVLMIGGLIGRAGPGWRFSLGPIPIEQAVPLFAIGLFVLCMFLHGELALRRPAPVALTRFYLMLSLGGAAGGVFTAVAAPALFNGYFELPLSLAAVAVVLLCVAATERTRFAAFVGLVGTASIAGLAVKAAYVGTTIAMERDFYGVLRVSAVDGDIPGREQLRLAHGNTVHGQQLTGEGMRGHATSYYGSTSGIGRVLAMMRAIDGAAPQRVGVVGLGTGTLAAYGRLGDVYRFYEIDPAVERLARAHFSFLRDSAATVQTVLGDGRLLLEREASQAYRILAIDAFSSDSIPVHLLTAEAMRVYARHVDLDGAVAFHISNRYLDLAPVIRRLADSSGRRAVAVNDTPPAEQWWATSSQWVIVTSNARLADRLMESGGMEVAIDPRVAPWSDSYSNLFDVLKSRRAPSTADPAHN